MSVMGLLQDFAGEFCKNQAADFGKWIDSVFALVSQPFEFDWLSTLMTEFQGIAIIVVFVIVAVRGVTTGILLTGGSQDESVGHYLFTSFVPIALIAATPAIVGAVCQATTALVASVSSVSAGHGADVCQTILASVVADDAGFGISPILCFIICIAVIYYAFSITLQCVKRWALLEVLSLIAPLVCITTATEDNGSYVTLLKSMFATGLITMVQLLLFYSATCALGVGSDLAASAAPHLAGGGAYDLADIYGPMLVVALLSASKNCPQWIERYTDTASMPGRGGIARTLGSGIRTARALGGMTGLSRAVRAVGKA